MCLIIFSPDATIFPRAEHTRAVMNNPHGCGIMWREADQTRRARYFNQPEKAYRKCEDLAARGLAFAIHYRYATHGTTDITNVHPFVCGNGAALMHNGVIDLRHASKSDTAVLADSLAEISPRWYRNPHVWNLLELSVEGSRLVVCTPDGWRIVHEKTGHWHEGRWYSARSRGLVAGYQEMAAGGWAGGNGGGKIGTASDVTLQAMRAHWAKEDAAKVSTVRRASQKSAKASAAVFAAAAPTTIGSACVDRRAGAKLWEAWQAAERAQEFWFRNPATGTLYVWNDDAATYLLAREVPESVRKMEALRAQAAADAPYAD